MSLFWSKQDGSFGSPLALDVELVLFLKQWLPPVRALPAAITHPHRKLGGILLHPVDAAPGG